MPISILWRRPVAWRSSLPWRPGAPIPFPKSHPRKTPTIPAVHWRLDDHPIGLSDWLASSIANGGYDTLRGTASIRDRQRFPSSFEQGAPIRAYLPNGRIVYEGELAADPIFNNGTAEILADGPKIWAEQADDQLQYQSRDSALFSDEANAPYNATPAGTISVSVTDGALHFRVEQDTTVAQNDKHGLVAWIPPSVHRRFRGTMGVVGDGSGWQIRVERATGPTGTRNVVNTNADTTVSNGALIDSQETASPEDMLIVSLRRSATALTMAAPLDVYVRDMRVNDLTLLDDFSASACMSDVGRRLGYDVEGLPSGPGVDTATPAIESHNYFMTKAFDPTQSVYDNLHSAPAGLLLLPGSYQPAVITSPLNVLPLSWGGRFGGTWAELLDHVAAMLDWRWRVIGNAFGRGPVLQFGPWGPAWEVRTSLNAVPSFVSQPRFNKVVVRYVTADHGAAEEVKTLEPDPLKHRGRRERVYVFDLPGVQKDGALATVLANALIDQVGQPRVSGSLDIVGADNGMDDMTIYDVKAGDMALVSDYGPAGVMPLRISQAEMSPDGVRLGIGQAASVASMLALDGKRQAREPFGTITRHKFFDLASARRNGLIR